MDRKITDVNGIIGNTSESKTQLPKKRESGQFYIWDTPGFEDTKGSERRVANTCYLKRLFDIAVDPKIFIVVSHSSFLISNNRGKIFKETIHMICEWMKNINNFEKSLSLVITNSDPRKTEVDDIIEKLNEYQKISADTLIKDA